MRYSLEQLRDDAYGAFKDGPASLDVQLALNDLYREADAIVSVVMDDDGFQEFASGFISREKTKLEASQRDAPQDHPYEGERSRPLCTCDDRYCELKDGRLPRRIRQADDPIDAMRRFKHRHSGDPLVLQDLRTEYDRKRGRLEHIYRTIYVCGDNDVHPDELEATPSVDTDSPTAEIDEPTEPTPADD